MENSLPPALHGLIKPETAMTGNSSSELTNDKTDNSSNKKIKTEDGEKTNEDGYSVSASE